ncbi:MAG: hypothetical protein KAJ79_07545, partial [Candidatus Omnitrophica bacterium]|nr:hypothetical protein [Candidatus Omnitrophota bacterium]
IQNIIDKIEGHLDKYHWWQNISLGSKNISIEGLLKVKQKDTNNQAAVTDNLDKTIKESIDDIEDLSFLKYYVTKQLKNKFNEFTEKRLNNLNMKRIIESNAIPVSKDAELVKGDILILADGTMGIFSSQDSKVIYYYLIIPGGEQKFISLAKVNEPDTRYIPLFSMVRGGEIGFNQVTKDEEGTLYASSYTRQGLFVQKKKYADKNIWKESTIKYDDTPSYLIGVAYHNNKLYFTEECESGGSRLNILMKNEKEKWEFFSSVDFSEKLYYLFIINDFLYVNTNKGFICFENGEGNLFKHKEIKGYSVQGEYNMNESASRVSKFLNKISNSIREEIKKDTVLAVKNGNVGVLELDDSPEFKIFIEGLSEKKFIHIEQLADGNIAVVVKDPSIYTERILEDKGREKDIYIIPGDVIAAIYKGERKPLSKQELELNYVRFKDGKDYLLADENGLLVYKHDDLDEERDNIDEREKEDGNDIEKEKEYEGEANSQEDRDSDIEQILGNLNDIEEEIKLRKKKLDEVENSKTDDFRGEGVLFINGY